MAEHSAGGPAFPHPGSTNAEGNVVVYPELGMTLRDYFAAQAIASIPLRRWDDAAKSDMDMIQNWATCAYAVADAMLAERSK